MSPRPSRQISRETRPRGSHGGHARDLAAFEAALSKCSTEYAAWFIIPANRKWFRNLAVSRIVAETLESLDMRFPEPTVDLDQIKQKYHAIAQEERIGAEMAVRRRASCKKGKKPKRLKGGE